MYTLLREDAKPKSARVFYTTPCGSTVLVARVDFRENKENMVVVELVGGKQSLSTLSGIHAVVKAELDSLTAKP